MSDTALDLLCLEQIGLTWAETVDYILEGEDETGGQSQS